MKRLLVVGLAIYACSAGTEAETFKWGDLASAPGVTPQSSATVLQAAKTPL